MFFYSLSPSQKDDFSFCGRYCFLKLILMNGKEMVRLIILMFLFLSPVSNAMIDGKRLNQFCNVLEEKALCLMYIRGLDDARRLVELKLDPG